MDVLQIASGLAERLFVGLSDNPYAAMLIAKLAGWIGFGLYVVRVNKARSKASLKKINWDDECQLMEVPQPGVKPSTNAAQCALFAVAAYPSQDKLRDALQRRMKELGYEFYVWSNGPVDGIIIHSREHRAALIAISGTDSLEDARLNLQWTSVRVANWGLANGIEVARDAEMCRVPLGFGAVASMAYKAVTRIGEQNNIEWMSLEKLIVTGHSQGGAAASILTMTKQFQDALAYTYNSARPYRYFSQQPRRQHFRVFHWLDIVPALPPQCRHQRDATQLLIRGTGVVLPLSITTVDIGEKAMNLLYRTLRFCVRLVCYAISIVQRFNRQSSVVESSHSCVALYKDLRPLR